MTRSQWIIRGLAAGALVVAASGGVAAAASKPTSYTACATAKHVLSVEKAGKCPKGTKKVSVGARGPAGAKGSTGPKGSTGAQGPAGTPPAPDLSRVASNDWWGGAYGGSAYHFDTPDGITYDGTHLWVANLNNNSVTELTTTGAVVANYSTASYGFDAPVAIGFDGTHLWVVNQAGGADSDGSLTEMDTNGTFIKTIDNTSGAYDFDAPSAITVGADHLWVTNTSNNSLTMMNLDGSLVESCSGPSYTLVDPDALVFDGKNIWVVNDTASGSVSEISGTTGDQLTNLDSFGGNSVDHPDAIAFDGARFWLGTTAGGMNNAGEVIGFDSTGSSNITFGSQDGFVGPSGIVFDGSDIWVANSGGGDVTEFDTTGTIVRVISGASNNAYGLSNPLRIAFDGSHVWVTNGNNSVSDIATSH